jgi:hypothetical protein
MPEWVVNTLEKRRRICLPKTLLPRGQKRLLLMASQRTVKSTRVQNQAEVEPVT